MDARIVLFDGDDEALKLSELDRYLESIGAREPDAERESFPADTRHPTEWIGAAGTPPFFSEHRVVEVRNISRARLRQIFPGKPVSKNHPLVEKLAGLPETARLVLVADTESGDRAKRDQAKTAVSEWRKIVSEAGGFVHEATADRRKGPDMVVARAKELGTCISRNVATELLLMLDYKVGLAYQELEKLTLYRTGTGPITAEDVRATVPAEVGFSVFALVDEAIAGNAKAALGHLRSYIESSKDYRTDFQFQSAGAIRAQLSKLWQARALLEGAGSDSLPDGRNVASDPPWLQNKSKNAARRLSFGQIAHCMGHLENALAELNGQRPSAGARETLEQMTLAISATCGR